MRFICPLALAVFFAVYVPSNGQAEGPHGLTKIQIDSGPLSLVLSGKKVHLSSNEPFTEQKDGAGVLPRKCVLEGDARFSLADDDFVVTANRIEFESDGGEFPFSEIVGIGDCEISSQEGDFVWKAESFRLNLLAAKNEERLVMTGHAVVTFDDGDDRVTIEADSIVSTNETDFIPSGRTAIRRVPRER